MKNTLLALASLGAFAGPVFAQSSVTMTGTIDLGVRAVKNGDAAPVNSLTRDGMNTSKLTFAGDEDLGGGMRASFVLDGRLVPDTGAAGVTAGTPLPDGTVQGTKYFDLRSTVSLSGPFGEVRLGRDYAPSFNNLAAFDVYGAISVGPGNLLGTANFNATSTLGSAAGTLLRVDNTIAYHLPRGIGGGFYGVVMAAAGEGVNSQNANNGYAGARLGWERGPFNVAGAYGRTRIPGNDDFRVWNVGAGYRVPAARLVALYHRAEWRPNGLANRTQDYWSIGVNVPLFGLHEIRAAYGQMNMSGGGTVVGYRDQDDARSVAVGYIYNLSKRTAVYADVARINNRGLQQLSFLGGQTGGSNFGTVPNRSSTAVALAIRHHF